MAFVGRFNLCDGVVGRILAIEPAPNIVSQADVRLERPFRLPCGFLKSILAIDPAAKWGGTSEVMTVARPYALHSDEEPARLDRQAEIIGIEQFLRHIPETPNARILDAGCGAGSMTRLLARTRADAGVIGLDIRPSYLDYARRKAVEEELSNVEFVEGSLLNLQYPDGYFDVVWACLVLHWLPAGDVDQAMRELVRVVRPGGRIVCAEPDGVGTNHFPIAPDLAEQWRLVTTSLFDPDMGRRLYPTMHRAGLTEITVDTRPYFFHAFGSIDPDVLAVILDALRPALPRIGEILGSQEAASRMLERIVEQHQDPATVFFPLWFVVSGQSHDHGGRSPTS